MGRAKPKAEPIPETVDAATLAEIAGVTDRWIQRLATDGVLPTTGKDQYPFKPCLAALIAYYKEQAKGHNAERSADRARRERAEADSAEMDAEKKRGTLMLAADARRWWADGFAKVRDVIARSGIKAEEKKRISEQLLKIKLDDE